MFDNLFALWGAAPTAFVIGGLLVVGAALLAVGTWSGSGALGLLGLASALRGRVTPKG